MRANGTHRLTSQMAFREITHLIENNLEQLNYGVAITDIDTDGEFEAVVMGFGYPNVILKRDGEKLVNVATGLLSDEEMNAIGVASGDIDGDGQEEIYFLNTDSLGGEKQFFDRLISFENDKFIDLFALSIHENIRNAGAGRSVVCIDRSGRGRYGFFIANYALFFSFNCSFTCLSSLSLFRFSFWFLFFFLLFSIAPGGRQTCLRDEYFPKLQTHTFLNLTLALTFF